MKPDDVGADFGKPLMMAKIAVAVLGLGAIALDLCFPDADRK
jgi:hypothetical protein